MRHKRFLESEFSQYPPAHARFHVLPVPFEASVSYGGGTADGPAAILTASDQLEVFDGYSTPGEEGIHTHPSLPCDGTAEQVFPHIESAVREILMAGKEIPGIPVILGGEHSITGPAFRGVQQFYRDDFPVGLIQIDAHADLRDSYEGTPLSHASVVRRIHADMAAPVLQIGVRGISPEELIYRDSHGPDTAVPIHHYDAQQVVPAGITAIDLPPDFPRNVYLTVDADGLDPSVIAATGTPVPGGLGWYQLLAILEDLSRQATIHAFDFVELAPIAGFHTYDYTAAELVYRIMGMISRNRPR